MKRITNRTGRQPCFVQRLCVGRTDSCQRCVGPDQPTDTCAYAADGDVSSDYDNYTEIKLSKTVSESAAKHTNQQVRE